MPTESGYGMKPHWCRDCKGTGRVSQIGTRIILGQKKNYTFAVDCPAMLMEQIDTTKLPISGQDRAAGEEKSRPTPQNATWADSRQSSYPTWSAG